MIMSCFPSCLCCNESNPSDTYKKKKDCAFVAVAAVDDDDVKDNRVGMIPYVWSRTFHENYRLGRVLGVGGFSVVHEATRRGYRSALHEPETYAVKIVERYKLDRKASANLKEEVQILSDLRHENIIRLCELYRDPYYYFVVMEKLGGGELYDRLCEKQFYSEMDARNVCRTVFGAMAYCHSQKVAHRDLKPENLLLKYAPGDDNNDDTVTDTAIKIADFGFAKKVKRPNSLITQCGSPAYTAPEIIRCRPYDQRVDNWSLGVIVYTLLGGYAPFRESTVHMTFQQILQANFQFHHEYWDGVSTDAKDLIRKLLNVDPEKRITSEQVLQHPWMTGRGDDLSQKLITNLKRFKEFNAERKKRSANAKTASYYWLLTRR